MNMASTVYLSHIEPNHAASVKLIFLILTVVSAGILFYYVTAALILFDEVFICESSCIHQNKNIDK